MPRKNKKEYNEYMQGYMVGYRADQKELLTKAKKAFGWKRSTQKKRRKVKK